MVLGAGLAIARAEVPPGTVATPTVTTTTTGTPPELTAPELTVVAAADEGSDSPTAWAGNQHLVQTAGGRLLALHGFHATGLQVAWRDGTSDWRRQSRGAVTDGLLISDTGTGDWPASIVLGFDDAGAQVAWVAFGGDNAFGKRPVHVRRLSDLDHRGGPTMGPLVTVVGPGNGAGIVDIALDQAAHRGAVSWASQDTDGTFDHSVTWFTDLDTDEPSFTTPQVLTTGASAYRTGTLFTTPDGLAFAHRNGDNELQVDVHRSEDPVGTWRRGIGGVDIAPKSTVGAVALPSGEILATVNINTSPGVQIVQRFSADGAPFFPELALTGYMDGSLATADGTTWLVAVRTSDGFVVSRFLDGSSWSSVDRLEIGPEGGGGYAWPSVMRASDDTLHILVQGPLGGASQRTVLAYRRPIELH